MGLNSGSFIWKFDDGETDRRPVPVSPSNGKLLGSGRAVSDLGDSFVAADVYRPNCKFQPRRQR